MKLEKRKSILIIEDEPDILECFKLAIDHIGYFDSIVTASSIGEAVFKLQNQTFDHCLTDLNLGRKSILDIFEKDILKKVSPKNITVLSAFLDSDSVSFFINSEIKHILTKPIMAEALIAHYKGITK